MKKAILVNITFIFFMKSYGQTNVFPASGNVGIGTTIPSGKLQVNNGNGQSYFVNFSVPGSTENATGENFLLLHKGYMGTLMNDYFTMGKIVAKRGSPEAWNRKWSVEVNTASAYNADRGSIMTYNEGTELVTLMYNGEKYLALRIKNGATLFNFSFTGYAQNASLQLVYDQDVSDVQAFTSLDAITIQGNMGIGTNTIPTDYKLAVAGKIIAEELKVQSPSSGWPDYVFDSTYQLPQLSEVERFIKANKHLPDVPSAQQVHEEGIEVSTNQAILLKKIEELTLHLIEVDKRMGQQKLINESLQKEVNSLKRKLRIKL